MIEITSHSIKTSFISKKKKEIKYEYKLIISNKTLKTNLINEKFFIIYINQIISNIICHPYHIVDESPWPLFGAVGGLYFTTGIVS